MNSKQLDQIRDMVAYDCHEQLKALELGRFEIRTVVLPLVRERLGEIPPIRVDGLTSNWVGKNLMSRYGV